MKQARAILALPLLAVAAAGCGGTPDVGQAIVSDVSRSDFTVAAANMASWYTGHGTYAGANPGVAGVTLVRGDASSWCLQTTTEHEDGPGGVVQPGPC